MQWDAVVHEDDDEEDHVDGQIQQVSNELQVEYIQSLHVQLKFSFCA